MCKERQVVEEHVITIQVFKGGVDRQVEWEAVSGKRCVAGTLDERLNIVFDMTAEKTIEFEKERKHGRGACASEGAVETSPQ